jgi:hypothetical protein
VAMFPLRLIWVFVRGLFAKRADLVAASTRCWIQRLRSSFHEQRIRCRDTDLPPWGRWCRLRAGSVPILSYGNRAWTAEA